MEPGIFIVERFMQPSNMRSHNICIEFGNSIDAKLVHPEKALDRISYTPSGIIIVDKLGQSKNSLDSITLIESGRCIDDNFRQPSNAELLMIFTELGMLIKLMFEQLLNTLLPIAVNNTSVIF